MKQKDLALILVIVFISAIASLLISKTIFKTSPDDQKAEVIMPVSASFETPDKKYFNDKSYDPTKLITIGQDANPAPFTEAKQ